MTVFIQSRRLDKTHFLQLDCLRDHMKQQSTTFLNESETTSKKESRWTQNVSAMALKGSPKGETSLDNTLSYSNVTGDMTSSETQFIRLKTHLLEDGGCSDHDLHNILLPVFVHMCTDLLLVGQRNLGHKFCTKHKDMFRSMEKYTELLDTLLKSFSRTKTEVMACKDIQNFREMKFKISIEQKTFTSLMKFLKNDDNMIVIQIFNQHVKIVVHNKTISPLGLVEEVHEGSKQQPISPAVIPDNKVVQDDAALSSLKHIIKEVREGPGGLPSICFYTFLNAYQGLCCASVSCDNEYLSGGFESSHVQIWRLTPGLFPTVTDNSGPTEVFLSADFIHSTTDSEEEEDTKPKLSTKERETVMFKGHTSSVYQTRFTWDSNYLLSCSEDKTVRIWDIDHQKCAAVYRGHNYPVWDIDTSLVGDYFVSGSQDQTAKLWSTERVYPLRSFVGHTYDVDCVRFHPNGNYIATGSGDKTVRLWSVQEGKSVRLLQGHKSSVLALAFSPNGMLLASAGEDRRVRVWDLRTGSVMKEYRGHTDTIHSLSFNHSNNVLASGGLDCSIRLWDTRRSLSSTPGGEGSSELLGSFPTKSIPVTYLNYTDHNLLQAAGAV